MRKQVAKTVCRAVYPLPSAVQHMGIDHCCTDILVAKQFPDGANVLVIKAVDRPSSEQEPQAVIDSAHKQPHSDEHDQGRKQRRHSAVPLSLVFLLPAEGQVHERLQASVRGLEENSSSIRKWRKRCKRKQRRLVL